MQDEYLKILRSTRAHSKYTTHDERKPIEGILEAALDGSSEAWNAILEFKRLFDSKQLGEEDFVFHPLSLHLRGISSDSFFKNEVKYGETLRTIISNYPELEPMYDKGDLATYFKKHTQFCASALPIFVFDNPYSAALDVSRGDREVGASTIADYMFCSGLYYMEDYLGDRDDYDFDWGWPFHIIRREITNLFEPFGLLSEEPKRPERKSDERRSIESLFNNRWFGYWREDSLEWLRELESSGWKNRILEDIGDLDADQPNLSEEEKDYRHTALTAYRIDSIFHKWEVLLSILYYAQKHDNPLYLPEFNFQFNKVSVGFSHKITHVGYHLLGCSLAFFKVARELETLNKVSISTIREGVPRKLWSSLERFLGFVLESHNFSKSLFENKQINKDGKLTFFFENYYYTKGYCPYYFGYKHMIESKEKENQNT